MDDLDKLLQDLTDNLDKRRFEFTRFRRLVFAQANSPLEPTAVRMGIPMIYAEWEGYIREVCQLYLEYIETTVKSSKDLTPALLGYMWTPILKPITGGLNHDKKLVLFKR